MVAFGCDGCVCVCVCVCVCMCACVCVHVHTGDPLVIQRCLLLHRTVFQPRNLTTQV